MEKSNTMSQISDYYPFPSYPQYQREMLEAVAETPDRGGILMKTQQMERKKLCNCSLSC